MPGLDFGKLSGGSAADVATEPRRIFAALPTKDSKYGYPRDVQTQVWDDWHARRSERDLTIKMNTGSGKTVVGLMVLKSCLNEGVGPAVYVAPDNYLVDQVRDEAALLGVETTSDPDDATFRDGRSILVVNIDKLVNGRSVFGVTGANRPPLDVGSILVDDVHACLAKVDGQFSLRLPSSHSAYAKLIKLFESDLEAQSPTLFRDIVAADRTAVLQIPPWAWADRRKQVTDILHAARNDDELKFGWPLIAECLDFCSAAVSADEIVVRPPCPPIDRIPSFDRARRRMYLTATLSDDSVLVTHFGASAESARKPITPKTADDLGDRMILVPSDFLPSLSDEDLRKLLKEESKQRNVVVIVPSEAKARAWAPYADALYNAANIQAGVAALKRGHVGLVTLLNKYDGIDLPGDACRILVLDSLPEVYGPLDRIEAAALGDSDVFFTRQVQRIEQGMGRGVRSNDDYCVVVLMGRRLTARIHGAGISKFSDATKAQLGLSRRISDELRGRNASDMIAAMHQCLSRETGWINASRGVLSNIDYSNSSSVSDSAIAEREAFDLAEVGNFAGAADRLVEASNAEQSIHLRGWLKQQAAAYMHRADPVRAQKLQLSAKTDNRALLKPREGFTYARVAQSQDQADRLSEYLRERYTDSASLIVGFSALLDDLRFDPDTVPAFEQALSDLGDHLGFAAQRPERDFNEGPDVLWAVGSSQYFVIECKSGVQGTQIAKSDVAQLSHSIDWFKQNYDPSMSVVPILIHRGTQLRADAAARDGTRIIDVAKLDALRDGVSTLMTSLAHDSQYKDPKKVVACLVQAGLDRPSFLSKWSSPPR